MTSTDTRASSGNRTTESANTQQPRIFAAKDPKVPMEQREKGGGATWGKAPFGVGVLGAFIGSACCALPAVAFALGGASGLVGLTRYQPYFLATSLLFVLSSTWYLTQRREACCVGEPRRRVGYVLPLVVGGTYLIIYLLISYVVVPMLYGATPVVLHIG